MPGTNLNIQVVKNGYMITLMYGGGKASDIYVASDFDGVLDVIKLIAVRDKLDV